MKIGVLFSAYNSESYIDECVAPWFELKEEMDITIGCNSGMYVDYLKFGFKPKNKPTLHKLVNHDFDFIVATGPKALLGENDSKNTILHVLKNTCDVVWIVDSDEFYTKDEIRRIVQFINDTPYYDWYSVNLKNSTFEEHLWINGFCPPRIFRTDRNGGINEFYFDNHISYNDGTTFDEKLNTSIPRTIAWVKHLSWLTNDPRTPEKIEYQNMRFDGGCSLKFEEGKLEFIPEFYHSRNIEVPILHETIDILSNEFTITYSRNQNTLFVEDVLCFGLHLFKIYDGQNNDLIYETMLDLSARSNYFISPSTILFNELPDFNRFRIEVIKDGNIIHNEFLYIKHV
jgi:hypothetical protein